MTLTKRQKEVLDFLVSFVNKHGYSPSFEEIARALRLTSLATVHKHITTLERKGYIRRGYNQSRSIEVTQLPKPVREQLLERHSRGVAAGRAHRRRAPAGGGGEPRDIFAERIYAGRRQLCVASERRTP